MYAFFIRRYNGKRYRLWGTPFSQLNETQIKYEFLKEHCGYPKGSEVQPRMYDVNSQQWKWLGDGEAL